MSRNYFDFKTFYSDYLVPIPIVDKTLKQMCRNHFDFKTFISDVLID